MTTWDETPAPAHAKISAAGWLRVIVRGAVLAALTFGCLALLLLARLVERPVCGAARPVTPKITKFVCRNAFRILGMGFKVTGTPAEGIGAAVANHSSWLDIFALNARNEIFFVSKSEVAHWPGIGWLARATGTLFVVRDRKFAAQQKAQMQDRFALGHRLLFFPEGTSTDGQQVVAFKPTLFQAIIDASADLEFYVQPITLRYTAPAGEDPRFYGWWGDMAFGSHLLHTLAAARHGSVEVVYHAPVAIRPDINRKVLAAQLHATVADGLT